MKSFSPLVILACLASSGAVTLSGSPVTKVVTLLRELENEVKADGKREQQSYDKYACWCEDTLGRKAKDISEAKENIEKLSELILKLQGDLGAHGAEIEQLKKDIALNLEAQREATEVRDKENSDFEGEKTENEQCVGALEAAIKALTGAGEKKGGFLETLQEAQLLSVAADVRRVLSRVSAVHATSEQDLQAIRAFVDHPEGFSSSSGRGSSALQAGQGHNPFGDYAPQSTQIQGILKGMYDAFTADVEKDNAEEAEKQKAFEALMATKEAELDTLKATLEKHETDKAKKSKTNAESKTERDDTEAQLRADEKFFESTKATCKVKANEWSERSRLRTQELVGIREAVDILNSEQARGTFQNSSTTLLQLSAVSNSDRSAAAARAISQIRALARGSRSLLLAEVAAEVKTGGHFDKVITMIDHMIETLRKEEASDIEHRDRCQAGVAKNGNDRADLAHNKGKIEAELARMGNNEKAMKAKVDQLDLDIRESKDEMDKLLEMRNQEVADFRFSLKMDQEAVDLINQAIVSLSKFYKRNKIPLSLVAQHRQGQDPEYTVDQDKAPETAWEGEGGAYGGRKGESSNIIAILEMIIEDTELEMKNARADDAEAQKSYEEDRQALADSLRAQEDTRMAIEKARSDLRSKKADKEADDDETAEDMKAEEEMQKTLAKDCTWVADNFETRRTKRKNELDGLAEAKSILAGAETGDYDELVLNGF